MGTKLSSLITLLKRSPTDKMDLSKFDKSCPKVTDFAMAMDSYKVVTGDMVNVWITSNITSFTSQKKMDKSITVAELKSKLELICGASAGAMTVTVFDKEDKKVCSLEDDNAIFGSHHVDDGMRLHVEDSSKTRGEFENTDKVEKFELGKEEYSKRTDTVQAYLKKNKLGKYNEEEMAALAKEKEEREAAETKMVEEKCIVEGARAEIVIHGSGKRRGTVRFVGQVHFQPGTWVGIQYDEPTGKNDGSVGGTRYFTCQDKYGGFVRPATVEVGDFPEEDLDFSDGEM